VDPWLPTYKSKIWPAVTENVVFTTAPPPPVLLPPPPPVAVTLIEVTPVGTVQGCTDPVYEKGTLPGAAGAVY
jgi:hypothetical protein